MDIFLGFTGVSIAYLIGVGYGFRQGCTYTRNKLLPALVKLTKAASNSAATVKFQMGVINQLEAAASLESLDNRIKATGIIH